MFAATDSSGGAGAASVKTVASANEATLQNPPQKCPQGGKMLPQQAARPDYGQALIEAQPEPDEQSCADDEGRAPRFPPLDPDEGGAEDEQRRQDADHEGEQQRPDEPREVERAARKDRAYGERRIALRDTAEVGRRAVVAVGGDRILAAEQLEPERDQSAD